MSLIEVVKKKERIDESYPLTMTICQAQHQKKEEKKTRFSYSQLFFVLPLSRVFVYVYNYARCFLHSL
jgi:hypothetical protein